MKQRKHPIELTADRLRELMIYDPTDGSFAWRIKRTGVRFNTKPGRFSTNGYWRIAVAGECHLAHRLAWLYMTGEWPVAYMDHIDGNRNNNVFSNLRECTSSQNHQNKKPMSNNKSRLKGAWYCKIMNRWRTAITINGKQKKLGYFDTPEEAHAAYYLAAKEVYGAFARAK